MAYTSLTYLLLFLGITFVIYHVVPLKRRWIVILIANLVFYLLSARYLVIFLFLSALSVYFGALGLEKYNLSYKEKKKGLERDERKALKALVDKKKKRLLTLVVLFNLSFIAVLKYGNFFGGLFNDLFKVLHVPAAIPFLHFLVPLGISFYTLQAISYMIDVNRGKYNADHHFGRVFNYLIFFPTVTEGPIARYDQVAASIHEGHPFNYQAFTYGLQLIMWGLFKKFVIADRANLFVRHIFMPHSHYTGFMVLLGILFYTIQLYCDFSGGIEIVSGSAEMFGIYLPENFKQPFFSHTINEFWRKWHITLGAWLKDYVFFSVSLSKPFQSISKFMKAHFNQYFGRTLPVICALFCVWTLMGLWHGASMKYVVYGLYYYILMVIGMILEPFFIKVCGLMRINRESGWFKAFQMIRTFIVINIGMLIFRADTLSQAAHLLKSVFINFHLTHNHLLAKKIGFNAQELAVLLIGIAVVLIVEIIKEKGYSIRDVLAKQNLVIRWTCLLCLFVAVLVFGAYGRGYDSISFLYGAF